MLAGGTEEAALYEGGVRDRPESRAPVSSGDKECKSACGTEFPKNSLLRTLEYVRLASSAEIKRSERKI